jgi:Na+-transporting NADH:ubiquinone oxidoreductase subunit B
VRAPASLGRIQLATVTALIPVIVAAVLNTGYQYLLAIVIAGDDAVNGWRDNFIRDLGLDYQQPSLLGAAAAGLVHIAPVLIMAIIAGGICERTFATRRDRPMEKGFVVSAIVFTLLLPPAVSLFHVAFGMIFGIVFGKSVFGGEGKTFLNPALLGAAVVQITFPTAHSNHPLWDGIAGHSGSGIFAFFHESGAGAFVETGIDWWGAFIGVQQGMMGTTSVLAVTAGGVILVWSRIASWRLILGHILGLVLVASVCNSLGVGMLALPWFWHLVLGSFAFGVVFVATDPASSASTDTARWIQGLIAGGLVVMIRVVNPSHPDGVVIALLLGSVLAPLIDSAVIWFNVRQRAQRYG